MQMKYREIPSYEEVDVVGKTVNSFTGTIDRKQIGRCLLTEKDGFSGKHEVVDGDGTPIVTVKRFGEDCDLKEVELRIELVGGIKSLASYKFYSGYVAANRENEGVTDVFVDGDEDVGRIVTCASRMCEAHPECDNCWKIVDKDGKRVFIRTIATVLSKTGKVEG